MLTKDIIFFGQPCTLACDGICDKAWGINGRPRDSSELMLADDELGTAPDDPGTYEGGQGKDPQSLNKWCARECERSTVVDQGGPIELSDFSERIG